MHMPIENQPKIEYSHSTPQCFLPLYRSCTYHFWHIAKSIRLALACSLVASQWADAEPVRIFNVDVYVAGMPECQLVNINPVLRATVSPFQENVMLGDVVTELARRAAQAGATVLHSIRLVSVIPSEGAQVTAIAGACLNKGLGPFNANLVKALYEANSARRFSFPQTGSFGPARSVQAVEKIPGEDIAGEFLQQLRTQIITSVRSGGGPLKACPFEPSIGFQFLGGSAEVWWLVSHLCETGMLVSASDNWRNSPLVNLTPDAVRNFEQTQRIQK